MWQSFLSVSLHSIDDQVYLYPAGGAALLLLFSLILAMLGLKINVTRATSSFFFDSGANSDSADGGIMGDGGEARW